MNLTDLYYNLPEAAYLLLCVFLFLFLFWILNQHHQKIRYQYAFKDKLKSLLVAPSSATFWTKCVAFCLLWVFLCLAFMQPKGNARYPSSQNPQSQNVQTSRLQPHEVIFFIDTSASMEVQDGRLGQSRLNNAKEIADQIMSGLQGQSGSLYAFTSEVDKISPPSMDYIFMRLMLRGMQINEGGVNGTDIKAVIQYLHDHYLNPTTSLIKTVIFISDGEDNRLIELGTGSQKSYIQDIVNTLGDPQGEHLHLYTIGVGTAKGGEIPHLLYEEKAVTSHLQEDLLRALSDKGMGKYYSAEQYAAADIAADIAKEIAKVDVWAPANLTAEENESKNLIYDLYYQFPLGLAILLLAYYLFWPDTSTLKNSTLMLFLSLFIAGHDLNASSQADLGAAYFSAQAYPEAIDIYQKLLHENLSEWEHEVITYNLGTTFATQGQWMKAIETFQQLPLIATTTSPLLLYWTWKNLLISNFMQGQSYVKQAEQSSSQDPYFQAIYFFKRSLDQIPETHDARCRLLNIMGAISCPEDADLNQIEILSKANIATMRDGARHILIEHSTLQQGLPWLMTGLKLIEQDIQFMLKNSISDPLKAEYQNFFTAQAKSWEPLWNALQDVSIEYAKKDFQEMLQAISEGDWTQAQVHLNSSMKKVNHLMKQVFVADPFQETVSRIFNEFSLASLQDPLESNTLLFLQQSLKDISIPKERETYQAGIHAMRDNLEHSLASIENHQDLMAQIRFNEAFQQLQRIQLLLQSDIQERPDLILEAAINEQRHALAQTRIVSRINPSDPTYSSALSFALNSQKYTLSFSNYFYSAVQTLQTKLFNVETTKENQNSRCQYSPWNQVIPLFQEGEDRASKVVALSDLGIAIQEQEKVIVTWKKALEKMKEPKNDEGCGKGMLSNVEQIAPQSFDNLSQLIQQMNNEDQRPVAPAVQMKEGLRPW